VWVLEEHFKLYFVLLSFCSISSIIGFFFYFLWGYPSLVFSFGYSKLESVIKYLANKFKLLHPSCETKERIGNKKKCE
jgi:hypothetical protein